VPPLLLLLQPAIARPATTTFAHCAICIPENIFFIGEVNSPIRAVLVQNKKV
jgi:hypothetical protein